MTTDTAIQEEYAAEVLDAYHLAREAWFKAHLPGKGSPERSVMEAACDRLSDVCEAYNPEGGCFWIKTRSGYWQVDWRNSAEATPNGYPTVQHIDDLIIQ